MGIDEVVQLGRMTLQEILILAAPVLGIAVVVSLLINVVQVVTSLQETTLSTVPRLLATGAACFFMMPWMWRHLTVFTTHVLSDFNVYLH